MIDPRAIIDPSAELADDVEVGPWTMIGPNVSIDSGTVIAPHVILKGPTKIGKNNKIYQFSSVGEDTPDMKYQGEPTWLEIGDNNVIREGVTIHRGTVQDRNCTTIGNDNLIMAYAHIGHDSVIGNHCIFVNNASVAGHVHVDDWAVLGGYSLIHQFCRVGTHAFTGMATAVGKDIPAYVMAYGYPAEAKGINAEGLKRRGFDKADIQQLQAAFKTIYRKGLTTEQALSELTAEAEQSAVIKTLVDSIRASTRGIVR